MDIAEEILRIEADISALELSYANGLISVGEFSMRMSELKAILELAKNVFERIQEIKQDETLTAELKVEQIRPRQYALYVIKKAVHLQVVNYPLLNELIIELYEASKDKGGI